MIAGFFLLGFLAVLFRSDLEIPKPLYQSLTIFLLLAIGLKGGNALADHLTLTLLGQSIVVIGLGFVTGIIAFYILRIFLGKKDAANIAAHYGSVSVGTYAVAVGFLESKGIEYEPYLPLFVVLLEMPAILLGLFLAGNKIDKKELLHEAFLNQGVLLMLAGIIIGYSTDTSAIMPFFGTLFQGVLCLFIIKMGAIAGERVEALKAYGIPIVVFGIVMPLIGASLGAAAGLHILGLSPGGTILLAVLGASCSYIAVPAVMTKAIPDANHGLAITSSLAITFPFNVIVGIELYTYLIQYMES